MGVEDAVLATLEQLLDTKGKVHNLEVEAKLGAFQFRQPPRHLASETIMHPHAFMKFESCVPKSAYLRIQKVLDDASESAASDALPDSLVVRERTTSSTRDDFYVPLQGSSNIRVSVDSVSGETIAVVQKERLADINVHALQGAFDFRISLNDETPAEKPHSKLTYQRWKRRTKYNFDGWAIDMTEVSQQKKVGFEVEIEIHTHVLVAKSEKDRRTFLTEFLQAVRVLTRASMDYTDTSFLPAMQVLPVAEQAKIQAVKRKRDIPEVCDDAYASEVGDAVPMVGHFLQQSVEKNALKKIKRQ